jgi:hypothetical protein
MVVQQIDREEVVETSSGIPNEAGQMVEVFKLPDLIRPVAMVAPGSSWPPEYPGEYLVYTPARGEKTGRPFCRGHFRAVKE